ncbi:MAG TPA: nucleotidyltransferase family protein [Candidatus Limnocylindrales bacterium]|nr:nucleotidyltransferase family protein [Candidatus Limnocylindrales bacterium]
MTTADGALLAPSLPAADRTLLLRALLLERDGARRAWQQWRARHPSLLDVLRRERTDAVAALLPLLQRQAERHDLELSPAEATRLRTASLREELRARLYAEVFGRMSDGLEQAGVAFLVLGGRPLAERLYERPELHHTGPAEIVIGESDAAAAAAALVAAGFRDHGRAGEAAWMRRRFEDNSGLVVAVGHTVLPHPHYHLAAPHVWKDAIVMSAAQRRVRTPALHDQLAACCVRGAWTGSRRSLLWMIDAALLARCEALRWPVLEQRLQQGHLSLPLAVVLGYLRATLEAPVPQEVVDRASRMQVSRLDLQVALAAAAAATDTSLAQLLAALRRSRRWGVGVRWAVRPDATVREWESGQPRPQPSLAAALQRPLGFVARRVRSAIHAR